jgi:hypothetical protein
MKVIALVATLLFLTACGGGGGGGSSYVAPSVVNTSYSGNTQTKTYSDGTTVTNTASSSTASYASDHVTRTTVYSYADGGSNSVVDTVNPTISTPTLTAAIYPSDWTTTGTVTAPTVSAKNNVYGDGYISAIEDGSSSKPFAQSTLSALSITDPNKSVQSSTTTYDLSWGTPDKQGPTYANLFPNATNPLTNPLSYMGRSVTSFTSLSSGPTLYQPSADVLAAWNAGWTGKGVNVLMVDGYSDIASCNNSSISCHGINTMMINNLVSPGATQFALDYGTVGTTISGSAKDSSNTNLTSAKSINVVNASFGTNWIGNGFTSAYGQIPTSSDITTHLASAQSSITAWTNFFSGSTSVSNLNNVGSAVIVKSAGNDGIDANYDQFVKSYAANNSINSRLLIVGALDKNGTVSSKATISNYSNTAGATANVANRFVVANGNTPYGNSSVGINGFTAAAGSGTSYAAPIVAGYAAVVMQKFPNLSAANTSNIILDTARTDTLSCHPSCSSAIYGKGEASLSRALAPVGSLR